MVKGHRIKNPPLIHPFEPGEKDFPFIHIPDPPEYIPEYWAVPCPECGVEVDEPCVDKDGEPITTVEILPSREDETFRSRRNPTVHVKRIDAYVDADLDGFGKYSEEASR